MGTLSSSATTITVADASRYEILQFLKIEDELLQVTARNTTTDVITVLRGVNGTTATAHTDYTIMSVNVIPDVALAATRLVAWAYQKRNDLGDRVQLMDGSSAVTEMPSFVRTIRDHRSRMKITSV